MAEQFISDYSYPQVEMDLGLILEKRMENDGNGNPIYIGYNKQPNAPTGASTWFIVKITYSGTNPVRYQLPDNGVKFQYDWDSRATFFS
jgi:hypothetical protein